MTVRRILRLGAAEPRTPAAAVTRFDDALAALVRDLMDTLDAEPGRAGVAAVQIGVGLRVFGYDADGRRGHLVNPVVVERSGEQCGPEACLSVPGVAYGTSRAQRVTVTGYDESGAAVTVRASGLLARALQHETDHLDGVLYLDRLTGEVRRRALRTLGPAAVSGPARLRLDRSRPDRPVTRR